MTLIIINGEIDLSVASVMGLAACVLAVASSWACRCSSAIVLARSPAGPLGPFNGFWVAYVGLPSLAVTLAGLIGYRGIARILVEDRSIGGFPEWFNTPRPAAARRPVPVSIVIYRRPVRRSRSSCCIAPASAGSSTSIGNKPRLARYSGVRVRRAQVTLFAMAGSSPPWRACSTRPVSARCAATRPSASSSTSSRSCCSAA